uniref:Putative ovule protein n=1 Tax=Solanum chacoense TaxID=4108 RepID=A0A0V0HHZ4_SOLCH
MQCFKTIFEMSQSRKSMNWVEGVFVWNICFLGPDDGEDYLMFICLMILCEPSLCLSESFFLIIWTTISVSALSLPPFR